MMRICLVVFAGVAVAGCILPGCGTNSGRVTNMCENRPDKLQKIPSETPAMPKDVVITENNKTANAKDCYLFTSFRGNGQDGLHLSYSYDGYKWTPLKNDKSFLTPKAGRGTQLMRDPCIVQGPDKTFHMVWTVSWGGHQIGYASSKDLIHWSEQKAIGVMEHEPTAQNCWAPEIFYDDVKQQWLIFWATTIPGLNPETDGQDGNHNHRMWYVTTKNFETFSKTKLFYDPGFNVIDSTIVKVGDRYLMFLKDESNKPFKRQKNIKMAWADKAEGPYSKASEPITPYKYWTEGPSVLKIGDTWFVYHDPYKGAKFQYGCAISKDLKHWEDISAKLSFPNDFRHGSVLKVSPKILDKLLELE